MAVENSAALRLLLRKELRHARTSAELTQKQVAGALDWSLSKVIRIENGKVGVSKTDLDSLLRLYRIHDESRIQEFVEMARKSKKQPMRHYRDIFSPDTLELFGLEASAAAIRQFEPLLVPVLLQTEDYTRTILKDTFRLSGIRFERALATHLERRALLRQRRPPEMSFVLGEAALRQQVGGHDVMRRQLEHLRKLDEHPKITVKVLPPATGAHRGLAGPFTLVEFEHPALDDMLYIERRDDYVTGDTSDETTGYRDTFRELDDLATSMVSITSSATGP